MILQAPLNFALILETELDTLLDDCSALSPIFLTSSAVPEAPLPFVKMLFIFPASDLIGPAAF
ncbi:Uncharacterised protein [Chlamydia trachomatis]|nr:Uncharacterised protein [Chlamydia trachomatis]